MKKTILVAMSSFMISSAFAQAAKQELKIESDTTSKDTVFIYSIPQIAYLKAVLMQSKVSINGEPFSGMQLNELLGMLDKGMAIIPKNKTQPKK